MSVDDDAVCWLSARVVPGDGKCVQYRRSGSATCRECSAWVGKEPVSAVRGVSPIAAAVETLNSMEVVSMAAKKCSVPGCPKNAQGGCDGKCKSHFKGTPPRKQPDKSESEFAYLSKDKHVEVIDVEPDLPAGFGEVVIVDGQPVQSGVTEFSTADFLDALDAAWEAKRSEMLCSLSGLDYRRSIRVQLDMLDAVEGLGVWA